MSLKDFVSNIWGKTVEPKIENYANELVDLLYYDKQLTQTVHAHLLKKYGNEVYYNDLDGYIITNNVIELLIKAIRGESTVQPRTERQFKNENTKRFIDYNPRYKRNKVITSRIPGIFSEIFNIVFSSLVSLNSHSELGKLQRTMEVSTETVLDNQQVLDAKMDKLLEVVQAKQPLLISGGVTDTATESIGKCPEEITRVTEKIKAIENEYQKNHRFNDALSHYYSLLQSVATTLVGHSKEHVNTLVCTLYCNIALCQSNLGLPQKAFESLSAIPTEASSKSKVYHFVFALVYVQQNDIKNYDTALNHINQALAIDANYHHAFTMRQFLVAHIHPENVQDTLLELETHYRDILAKDEDRANIAEYYQFHGLLKMAADSYSEAIEDFRLAETYGYDDICAKMNIAVAMYGEATMGIPKGQKLLAPSVNQNVMMRAIDILKGIIDTLKSDVNHDDVRKRAITLYTSACAAIGKHYELIPIVDYLYEGQEYDSLRSLLLGTSEILTDSQLSLLAPEDRLFHTVRNLMDSGDNEACKKYIIDLINEGDQRIPAPVYHILLQICLITKSSDDYQKFRSQSEEYGISGELLDSMDACAFELDGNISQAKMLYDKISTSSVDDNILENALRFYFRNNCTYEIRSLFLRMHDLIISNSMYIANAESIYREANSFFISQKDPIIEKILSELPAQLVSAKCRLQLHATYYSGINNLDGLLKCLNDLSCATGEFKNAFSTALCATHLFKYDEALNICHALETRTNNTEEKVNLFWLISDILLLQNNLDDSFLWAKKAHELTSTNPYDQSHQAFFARAFRCNHQEGLADILEYKEEHPVVVNWLHKFSISESDEDVVSCIENALEEFSPGHSSYVEQEREIAKLYKQGIVPINMLLQRYKGDLIHLFSFATEHKLIIAHGNNEKLMDDCRKLGQDIVVDALTLVLIAYHDCLSILDGFSRVYVNFGSIATIQRLFLSYGFPCLSNILTWFLQSNSIVFEPDGFIDYESDLTKAFSSDFVACCNIASSNNIPYLYCDLSALNYQKVSEIGIASNIEFISITTACYKSFANDRERLDDALYSLLKDSTFINFNASTITHQIRKQNYIITRELIAPFMCCSLTCDMHSFASVYLSAIKSMTSEDADAAVFLASIVLEDTLKIWKRGTYHRQLIKSFPNTESKHKATAISEYVLEILQGVKLIFDVLPSELSTSYETLSRNAGYITE